MPAAPTGLTVTVASPTQINISWHHVTGLYDLERERWSGSAWVDTTLIPGITQEVYSDSTVTGAGAGTHRYRVRSVSVGELRALQGTAAGTSTVLGALTQEGAPDLAGVASGSSTVSGSLSVTGEVVLQALAAGTSGAAGNLTVIDSGGWSGGYDEGY